MKRFFYTTAAVVAFAFSGMANTIELEEIYPLNLNDISFEEEISRDCLEHGAVIMEAILENAPPGMNQRELWNLAVWWGNVAIAFCEGYTWDDVNR